MLEHVIKPPPHSAEAESGVIGSLILGYPFDEVLSVVAANDFYSLGNKIIFNACGNLFAQGVVADVITLSEYLQKKNELDVIGGLAALAEIASNTCGTSNTIAYARIIRDRATQRSILVAARAIADSVYSENSTAEKISHAQAVVMSLDEDRCTTDVKSIQDVGREILEHLDSVEAVDSGFPTGFPDLDDILVGMERGCVHVIAARPSTGKTALAVNIVEGWAQKDIPVLVFSLEMTAKSLGRRIIASLGRVPSHAIRTRKMDGHWDNLSAAIAKIRNMKLFISETSGIGIDKIRSIARFQKKVNGIQVIVIDFLQLIRREKSNKSTSDEIGFISNEIKNMAKELNVAVLLLSQLNRGIESRTDKQPVLSDLRSSGDIEQDAETITFLYRPILDDTGSTTITVAKNRDGKVGQCTLALRGEFSRFESAAKNYYGGKNA